MRILLIEPPFSRNQVHVRNSGLAEPLSLGLLAANLPDHDVRILDMRLDPNLRAELESFKPDLVGAGCYATGLYVAKRLFREVKEWNREVVTIAGGHHASLLPRDFLDPNIDVVVIGEGEITLRELVRTIERRGDLAQVQGLAIRKDADLQLTPPRPFVDLNESPWPARHLVEKNRHKYFRASWRPIMSITTERGCPFRCNFCSMWKVNEGRYRVRSAESVVEEIASMGSLYPYIDFIDDNTLHDVKRARRICELIRERGIQKSYKLYARSDTVVKNPELIESWSRSGLKVALIGFESFRDHDLMSYGKHNSVKNNEEAIRILHANGVEIAAYFVVNPEWAEDDFKALSEYVKKWDLTHPIFTILTPLPGTNYYDQVKNKLITTDHEKFDFFHALLPTHLPIEVFQQRFYELWRDAYSFKNVLKRIGQGKFVFSIAQIRGFREFMQDLRSLATPASSIKPHSKDMSSLPP